MTATAVLELIGVGVEIAKGVWDTIRALVESGKPATAAELRQRLEELIKARVPQWLEADKAAADQALVEAAEHEFSTELKAELKKPGP